MMDAKEAVRTLKMLKFSNDDVMKAFEAAIYALEITIAKEPEEFHDGYFNAVTEYKCPNCGIILDDDKELFCNNCGQKIKW